MILFKYNDMLHCITTLPSKCSLSTKAHIHILIFLKLDSFSTTHVCSGLRLSYRFVQIEKYKLLQKNIVYICVYRCFSASVFQNHDCNHEFLQLFHKTRALNTSYTPTSSQSHISYRYESILE